MKIDEVTINAYGNLKNKNIKFNRGINLIKGSNESGKSTLLNYITSSFYGISRNKDGKDISDYDRYKPWIGEEFSGKVLYTMDDGETFEVYRNFNKKNPKIYNSKMEDISSNFTIDKKEGNKFFFEQIGIDKQMYLSTVVSAQQEVKLDEKNQNILVQKIANLAGTGDDNVSYTKALTKLENKIRDEIGTNKTTQKPMNIVENELIKINKEIDEIESYQDKKYILDEEKDKLSNDIKQLVKKSELANSIKQIENEQEISKTSIELNKNKRKENVEKSEKIKEEKKKNEEEIKIIEKSILELNNKLNEQNKRMEEIINKQANANKDDNIKLKNNNKFIYIILAILLLIGILISFFVDKKIISIIGIALLSIDLAFGTLQIVKTKKSNKDIKIKIAEIKENKESLNKEKNNTEKEIEKYKNNIQEIKQQERQVENTISMLDGQIQLIESDNKNIDKEIEKLKQELESKKEEQKQKIIDKYMGSIEDDDINNIIEAEDINKKISEINQTLNNASIKLKGLEIEEKTVLPQLDNLVKLKEYQENLNERYTQLKEKEEIINIATNSLKEAYEEMKTTITPKFTLNLSNTISKITDGKYNKATISDVNEMVMEGKDGDYIELNKLSIGTIDELYLSLRLSMVNDLSKEKLPIILDETFAYFDDNRLSNILKFIEQELVEHQVIILTCTNREKEFLEKLNIKYNLIEM